MAEAVATLALASSILQVIDFGTKIAKAAWKAYETSKRSDDSFDDVSQLQDVYNNLSKTFKALEQEDDTGTIRDDGRDGMKSLAKGCSGLAEELLDALREIGYGQAKTKRKALWAALKKTWKDEKIVSLQTRLSEFRSQLTLCLLISMRWVNIPYIQLVSMFQFLRKPSSQFAHESLEKQDEILDKLGKKSKHEPIGPSVLQYITSGLDDSSQDQQKQLLETDLIEAIRNQQAVLHDDNSAPTIKMTDRVYKNSIKLLLGSLEYAGMQDREDRVAEPHESTFKWIFEKRSDGKWISFRDWLESDDKMYWVTGKAASGKSTMMRYICHPVSVPDEKSKKSRSHKYLERWAGKKKLTVASFYFWSSGLELQASQKGLFLTLLSQILKQCPELFPLTSPSEWESLCLFGHGPQWSIPDLRRLLCRCIENLGQLDSTVALFIDGLDEFDGNSAEIISIFNEIRELPHHKLCVASRPWNEFQDAFAQGPSLRIEHLTHDDIKSFVTKRFESDPRFAQLQVREKGFANQLVEDIVSKASGVFLWVSLVVSSLLSGMANGDRIADFQKRLDLLPPDLSNLYRKIIQNLDPFYLGHTAQLFALVGASQEPMNLLLAYYVDEEDPEAALRMEHAPISDQEGEICMDTMRRRINSRCKGLLEVKGGDSTPQGITYDASTHMEVTVQYLHRTVKDFVESTDVQQTLKTSLGTNFDPHLKLLAGHLAYAKATITGPLVTGPTAAGPAEQPSTTPKAPATGSTEPLFTRLSPEGGWGRYAVRCFSHARCVQTQSIPTMVELLDGLARLCPSETSVTDSYDLKHHYEGYQFGGTFLSLATACNVVEYIRAKAKEPCLILRRSSREQPTTQWPLLMDVMFKTLDDDRFKTIARSRVTASTIERYKDTIEVLLERNANVNFVVKRPSGRRTEEWQAPLTVAAVGTMHTQHQLHLVALQLFTRGNRYNSKSLDAIILAYAVRKSFFVSSRRQLGVNIFAWYSFRNRLRKALEDATRGEQPNFQELWSEFSRRFKPEAGVDQSVDHLTYKQQNRRD